MSEARAAVAPASVRGPRRRVAAARLFTGLVVLAALGAAAGVAAADAQAGRRKAAACAACHGENGLAVQPNAPNLAGQPEIYVAEQLRQYRSGRRQHEVMSVVAKPLSDADIDDLAAWYASLRVEVRAP